MSPLIITIVAFGLLFVLSSALANGLTVTIGSVLAPLRSHRLATLGVLVANFVVVPLLVGLTLGWFGFAPQATVAFALVSVVAGAPFVAMVTRQAKGDAAFAASISLVQLVLTVPYMPFVLPWLLALLQTGVSVTAWSLLKPLLWFIVLPLALGVLVRWRYPVLADELAPHFALLSLVGFAVHVMLVFIANWDLAVAEIHTGEYIYSVLLPVGCAIVGYLVCLPCARGEEPAGRRGVELAAAIGTAQKGSLALICTLIFALGRYPVAGVVGLGSSVITIVVVFLGAAELGRRFEPAPQVAEGTAEHEGAARTRPRSAI